MLSRNQKIDAISKLAKKRRHLDAGTTKCGYSQDYKHIEYFHNGAYDHHDWLVPWTISACNVDSKLMLIAQDWASEDFLKRKLDPVQQECGHDPKLPTNENLKRLLQETFQKLFAEVYATDAFVFVKPKGMGRRIPSKDIRLSVEDYTLPLIDIIRPKLVICIGGAAYNAVRRTLNHRYIPLKNAPYNKCDVVFHGAEIYGVPHVGGQGLAATGGFECSKKKWKKLASRLARL